MRLTIGKKLGLGFGAVILLMAISSVIVYLSIARLNASADQLVDNVIPAHRNCNVMLLYLNQSVAAMRGYIISGDDPKEAQYFKEERQEAWKYIDGAFGNLKELLSASTDAQVKRNLSTLDTGLEPLRKAQQGIEDVAQAKDTTKIQLTELIKNSPRAKPVRDALEELKAAAIVRETDERKNMNAASTLVTTTLCVATLLAIAAGSIIAVFLSRRIASALGQLLTGVQAVAAGNLTGSALQLQSRDEIADLADGFNQMVVSLRGLLSEIGKTTAEVASASREISTSAQQQLTGLNETATSLNEITTTAEEFKTTMQEFADRANAVKEAAVETAQRAKDGRGLTRDSAERITQVRSNSQAAGQSVLHLAEQMQRIGEITATVNEVAEQTKLLALNASIEAARAGENGRGFAVVATQVRELANETKQSAARIEALIADTQKSMQDVAGKIQEGGRMSEDSVDIVGRVSQSFEVIAEAIEQTREAMTQINTATRQQEQGISELVSSITQIDSASKESVAAAEQTQQSMSAIDQRIQTLNNSVARFKT